METRFLTHAAKRIKLPSTLPPSIQTRLSSSSSSTTPKSFTQQAIPIGDYYASILSTPSPSPPPKPPKSFVDPNASARPAVDTNPITAPPPNPAILFSSRTVKLRERRDDINKKSVKIAGIWVPPKPEEPDDCCMSGCVNCVWDRYGEEMEEWVLAKRKADVALALEKSAGKGKGKQDRVQNISGTGLMLGDGEKGASHTQTSMYDDGGGTEGNWETGLETGFKNDDLFKSVPVGIREFMRLEKSLKEKHKDL